MEFLQTLPRYGEAFLRLLYPSLCATCGQLLELEEKGLCLGCLETLRKLKLEPSEERIRVSLAYGEEGWALYPYEGLIKDVLHQIKFRRRRNLLRLFADDLALFFKRRRPRLTAYDRLVPVPVDPRRRLEREFNQSDLIARMIQNRLQSDLHLIPSAIRKRRSTRPQSLLGRDERKFNLEGTFQVARSEQVQGRSVLLVDDIFTTGATFEEAAKALRAAGARRVGYLALARAFPH